VSFFPLQTAQSQSLGERPTARAAGVVRAGQHGKVASPVIESSQLEQMVGSARQRLSLVAAASHLPTSRQSTSFCECNAVAPSTGVTRRVRTELARKMLIVDSETNLADSQQSLTTRPSTTPPSLKGARLPQTQPSALLPVVLVVDDEPLMRLFVTRALRGAGYDTIEAASAEEALELLASDDANISLLVSDVQLPGLSGSELVAQARELLPELPTLLMSGQGKHWLVNERLIQRDADLLQKPFRIADLLGKLDRLLAQ